MCDGPSSSSTDSLPTTGRRITLASPARRCSGLPVNTFLIDSGSLTSTQDPSEAIRSVKQSP